MNLLPDLYFRHGGIVLQLTPLSHSPLPETGDGFFQEEVETFSDSITEFFLSTTKQRLEVNKEAQEQSDGTVVQIGHIPNIHRCALLESQRLFYILQRFQ